MLELPGRISSSERCHGAQSPGAVHLPCAPLASKTFHSSTFVVGSSFYCADSESGCTSHWKLPHPPWHLCSASGLPVTPTHCHHHCSKCFPGNNPMDSHGPVTAAPAAKRNCHGLKCNLSSKMNKNQCFLPSWLNQIISYPPDTS